MPELILMTAVLIKNKVSSVNRIDEGKSHPLEGFCHTKKIFCNKKSQVICIIERNNSIV